MAKVKSAFTGKPDLGWIAETEVWIKQQDLRAKENLKIIDHNKEQIAILVALNQLERKQAGLIRKRSKRAERELAAYKKKHGMK